MSENTQNTKNAGLTSNTILRIATTYAAFAERVMAFQGDTHKLKVIDLILAPLQEISKVAGGETFLKKGPINERVAIYDRSMAIGWLICTCRFIPNKILVNALIDCDLSRETRDDFSRWSSAEARRENPVGSDHLWAYMIYVASTREKDGLAIAVSVLNEFSLYLPEMLDDALKS